LAREAKAVKRKLGKKLAVEIMAGFDVKMIETRISSRYEIVETRHK